LIHSRFNRVFGFWLRDDFKRFIFIFCLRQSNTAGFPKSGSGFVFLFQSEERRSKIQPRPAIFFIFLDRLLQRFDRLPVFAFSVKPDSRFRFGLGKDETEAK